MEQKQSLYEYVNEQILVRYIITITRNTSGVLHLNYIMCEPRTIYVSLKFVNQIFL